MQTYILWIQHHWLFLSMLPAQALTVETIIKSAAEAHGYKHTANICDKIGNFLSFIADIIGGILVKKQPIVTIVTEPTPTTGS